MARHEHLTRPTRRRPHGDTRTIPSQGVAPDSRRASAARAPRGSGVAEETAVGKYVYCIVETKDRFDLGPIGIGGGRSPVYTVHFGDLAAVVSDTPLRLYDATRENLLAHELVNETVMKEHTVIPMSFSTIFRGEEDIVELLRTTGKAFGDVLGRIRGKFELGLKVVWNRERVVERIEAEHAEIRELKKEITETRAGSTYFARLKLGRLIEAALEDRADRYVKHIYETLQPMSAASRSNKLIGDSMILNAAFLVDRAREDEFDRAVESLGQAYADVLTLKYTGPWPPYNFVNIKLKLERVGRAG